MANNIDLIGDDGCIKQLVTGNFSDTNASYIDDKVKNIGAYAFYGCSGLTAIDFPAVKNIGMYAFYNCSQLISADFLVANYINTYAFQYCAKLTSIILRKSDAICTLSNKNAFDSTPISSGTGYIYVPRALVDSYKAASKWSTYANQFRALEDYTVDGTISGALDPSKI